MKFYKCKKCNKMLISVTGDELDKTEIIAGSTDAAAEKHVPVYQVNGNKVSVSVGSIAHPMTKEHFIEWIMVETTEGYQVKKLSPESAPKADFALSDGETVTAVYAYCNLHSLWKA